MIWQILTGIFWVLVFVLALTGLAVLILMWASYESEKYRSNMDDAITADPYEDDFLK